MQSEIGVMEVDHTFSDYFKCLKQVFIYITDRCNLSCKYCLYKPNLHFHPMATDIDETICKQLMKTFRKMGASKLTLIGGEPSQYMNSNYSELNDIINYAKEIDYEYLRLDTNGFFDQNIFNKCDFSKLDEISFSIDSHKAHINDQYRGIGSYKNCVDNIKKSIDLGLNVDVTACIHQGTIGTDSRGNFHVDELIQYASDLGIKRINFHPIFRMGVPRDDWTDNLHIKPHEWIELYSHIQNKVKDGEYPISVRIPKRYLSIEEYYEKPEYYNYCPVKMGERVLVHPNGIIRICALLIGTPYGIARYNKDGIVWDNSTTNETNHRSLNHYPCMNQTLRPEDMVPLCISFKADQDEFIWDKKIGWDKKWETV